MKTIYIIACVAILGFSNVQAQTTRDTQVQKEKLSHIDMLTQKLNLTSDQKADIAKTLKAFKATENRLKAGVLNATDKEEELTKLAKRRDQSIETYLTKEQYVMYERLTRQ